MMKYSLSFTGLLLCLAWLRGPVESIGLSNTMVSCEYIRGWWSGCDISITPRLPTVEDSVQIFAGGVWSDACVPQYDFYEVVDNHIRFYFTLEIIPPPVCAQVITPWGHTADLGALPTGLYEVTAYINDSACKTTTFFVLNELNHVYLPVLLKPPP